MLRNRADLQEPDAAESIIIRGLRQVECNSGRRTNPSYLTSIEKYVILSLEVVLDAKGSTLVFEHLQHLCTSKTYRIVSMPPSVVENTVYKGDLLDASRCCNCFDVRFVTVWAQEQVLDTKCWLVHLPDRMLLSHNRRRPVGSQKELATVSSATKLATAGIQQRDGRNAYGYENEH